jgi:hypothetical protein
MRLYQLALITTVIAGVMVSCALLPPPVPDAAVSDKYADSASDEVFRKVAADYAAARAEGLDFFAPNQFKQGSMALSRASSLRKAKADDMEILKQLYIAEKQLKVCRQVKTQAQQQMPEVLDALQNLEAKSVTQSFPSEFDTLNYKTSKLLRDIEDLVLGKSANANNNFRKEKSGLMKAIRDLEIKVVKHNTLNDTNIVFKEVDSLGGKRLAPKTYQQAKQALQAANDIIERNVKDEKAIEQAGKEYQFAVFHTLHVTREVDRLESLGRSEYEAYILELEDKLNAAVQAFGYQDIRNHALHEQIQVLTGLAQRLRAQKTNLVKARNAAMPEELQELTKLKEEHEAALQKNQELSQRISQLQSDQAPPSATVSEEEKKLKQKAALLEQRVSELLLQNNDLKAQRDSLQNKLNATRGK